MLTVTADSRR